MIPNCKNGWLKSRPCLEQRQSGNDHCKYGSVFAWQDGRENPDTFQTLLEYPKGFLVSYSTSFGNDAPSFIRFMGKKATLMNFGTEGTPRWLQVEEKDNFEDDPEVTREEKAVTGG
jgi:hypothetical protein